MSADNQSDRRRKIPAATDAALWALSNGRCYAPGCPFPVVYEVRPGVYEKNAQVAHIYGVKPQAPRYKGDFEGREAWGNLLLLCLAHHAAVDNKKSGEKFYPPEILFEWKQKHEGSNGPALAALGTIDEADLTDLLVEVFKPPLARLEAVAEQLEKTGTVNAQTVAELREIIEVYSMSGDGIDARAAHLLVDVAEVYGAPEFHRSAQWLAEAADSLPGIVEELNRAARRMPEL